MANTSLSPHRAAQRMLKYRAAVKTIAMMRAKQVVKAHIRPRGERVAQFSAKEIAELAEEYMAQHMEQLIAKATADVATFPEFTRSE